MRNVPENQQSVHGPTLPERWLARVEDWGIAIAAVVLCLIMIIVVIDVTMRYAFNNPLQWSYDLLSLFLIPTVIFLSLAQTLRRGQHIAVDVFTNLMPPRLRRIVLRTGLVTAAGSAILLSYILGEEALRSTFMQETAFGFYVWPIWIPKVIAAIGILILSFRVLVLVFRPDAPEGSE